MLVKSKTKRFIALFTMMIMLLGIFMPQNVETSEAATASLGKVKLVNTGRLIKYGSWGTYILKVKDLSVNEDDGGDDIEPEGTVFCINPARTAPTTGTYSISKIYEGDDTNIGKMMYAAPGQPGYSAAVDAGWYGDYTSYNDRYTLCHILFSWWNDSYSDGTDAFKGTSQGMINQVKYMREHLSDLATPKATYMVYYVHGKDSSYQNILGAYEKELSLVRIRKVSADTDVTDNNSDYSRGNMYFAIQQDGKTVLGYYDQEPQYINGIMWTTRTRTYAEAQSGSVPYGYTPYVYLEPGTYTIKEVYVDPDSGYKLNTRTETVTLNAGDKKTVEFENDPYTGQVEVYKEADDTKWESSSPSEYALYGAEYGLFKTESAAKTAKESAAAYTATTVYTDGQGKATFKELPYGTYWLAEISPSDGYAVDSGLPKKVIVNSPSSDPVKVNSEEPGKYGSITVKKYSTNGAYTYDNPFYVETECEYTLYKASNDKAVETKTIKKAADGTFQATFEEVPLGDYYIKETKAGTGYYLDETEYPVSIKDSGARETVDMGNYPVKSNEPYETVDVKVVKKSANEGVSCDNPNYSLAGAKFTVKNTTIDRTWTLTTKEDGTAVAEELPLGEYVVTEVTPPPGFVEEETEPMQMRTLASGTVEATFTFENEPYNDPPEVMLYKADSETGKYLDADELKEYYPQKGGSLAGAVFEVNFYAITEEDQPADNNYSKLTPTRTWYIETDEYGYANLRTKYLADGYESDEFYYSTDGKYVVLPIGTVTMQEVVAPQGYNLNDKLFVERVEEESSPLAETYQEPVIEDDIKRGDIEFEKVNSKNDRLAGIPFLLTVLEEDGVAVDESKAEKHIVVTDENGQFKSLGSWTAHTSNTNALDAAYDAETGTIDEDKLEEILAAAGEDGVGLWFGEESAISDDKGALPYGKYRLDELSVSANAGYNLITGIEFRVTKDTGEEYGNDNNVVDLGTLVDANFEFDTALRDSDTNSENLTHARSDVTLTDRITYDNVNTGVEYKIVGTLMNKEKNAPLLVDGKEVTAEGTFTATSESGMVELEYNFDATGLSGTTVVSYVEVYAGNILVGEHKDINDMDQSIKFVDTKLETTALNTATNNHYAYANGNVTITDEVSYENVMPGYSYVLKSTLMDKATGEPFKVDGKVIEVEKEIHPNKTKGSVTVTFPEFNADGLEGTTLVAYQELTWDGEPIAEHTDLLSEEQSVHFPKIVTKALDSATKDHISFADDEVTIIDTVTYSNVAPGVETTITGQLIDKETGDVIAENEVTFTPKSDEGEVEVPFTFKGKDYEGKDVVVYESMEFYGYLMAVHQDIDDAEQTVALPKVETKALGNDAEINIINPDKESVIKDTVEYTNLLEGRTYTVKGKVMDKATGKALVVDGKEITAEKEFTADKADGSIELEFTFDSTGLANSDLVVFETIYLESEIVGDHSDITSEPQTIHVSEVTTKALETGSAINVIEDKEEVVVTDKVEYKNLVPGVEYTLEGTIMVKETGEALKDGLFKKVAAEMTFTPEEKDGTIDLEFPAFDATELSNSDLVVFQRITYKGELVANHEDLTDENQTLHISDVKTKSMEDGALINILEPKGESNIIDTVEYYNLVPGVEYKAVGTLMNKATGEALVVDGKTITAELTFTPEEKDGTIELAFPTFDSTDLEGIDLVAFEEIYFENTIVGRHSDIDDEEQTTHVSKVRTTALEKGSTVNVVEPKADVVIVDTAEYENLVAGEEYTLKGVLVDKETGEPALSGGEEVKAEMTFTAEAANGTVELEFPAFDCTEYSNKEFVVMEELYYQTQIVGSHKDLNDDAQTIHVSEIGTTAYEEGSKINVIEDKEQVIVKDKVEYKNLVPGIEYTLEGVLMNKATGEPLKVGLKTIKATVKFTPEEEDGYIIMEFPAFDATALGGEDFVAFETVYVDNQIVGRHEDIDDEEQTVHISHVETVALENGSSVNVIEPKAGVIIADTANYYNLVPGVEYTVKAVLMNKETGKAVYDNGQKVSTKITFTPEEKDGTLTIALPAFDATKYAGQDLVVFETITYKGTKVAAHEKIDAESQTIHVSKMETTAVVDSTNSKEVEPSKDIVVKDTIEYSNLVAGKEYTVKGVLMNKDTGKALLINGEQVTAEMTFTPEKANGKVVMTFPAFDGSELRNCDIVVFEEMYHETVRIAVHADITDEAQTITVTEPPVQTGDPSQFMTMTALIIMTLAALAAVFVVRRRRFN